MAIDVEVFAFLENIFEIFEKVLAILMEVGYWIANNPRQGEKHQTETLKQQSNQYRPYLSHLTISPWKN